MFPVPYFPSGGYDVAYAWPDPAESGPLMTPLARLVTLAAASPTLRERCGLATDDPDASDLLVEGGDGFVRRIFYPASDRDDFAAYPAVIIFLGSEFTWEHVASGSQHYLRPRGTLELSIYDEDRYPLSMAQSTTDFANFVGNFLQDLASQFASDDELAGNEITQMGRPSLLPLEHSAGHGKEIWHAEYIIRWSS